MLKMDLGDNVPLFGIIWLMKHFRGDDKKRYVNTVVQMSGIIRRVIMHALIWNDVSHSENIVKGKIWLLCAYV